MWRTGEWRRATCSKAPGSRINGTARRGSKAPAEESDFRSPPPNPAAAWPSSCLLAHTWFRPGRFGAVLSIHQGRGLRSEWTAFAMPVALPGALVGHLRAAVDSLASSLAAPAAYRHFRNPDAPRAPALHSATITTLTPATEWTALPCSYPKSSRGILHCEGWQL